MFDTREDLHMNEMMVVRCFHSTKMDDNTDLAGLSFSTAGLKYMQYDLFVYMCGHRFDLSKNNSFICTSTDSYMAPAIT